jgi:hypothetical protein
MHAARPSVNAFGRTLNKKIDMETTTTQSETSAGADKPSLNPDALNQLLGQMVNDLGASANGALVVLGDRLGIYTTLADIGPATSQQLAKRPISMSDSFAKPMARS